MPRIAVIGLGRFGARLAKELTANGAEVVAIDRNRRLAEAVRDEVTLALSLDSTDEEALRAQGIDKVDCAIVGIGEGFEDAALATASLKAIGVPRVISRAQNETRGRILARIGADDVVYPERESAVRWAHRLMLPHLRDYVELGEGHSLVHVAAPAAFHNRTPAALDLRRDFHVNLVAIKRVVSVQSGADAQAAESHVVLVPEADTEILPQDILIVVGSDEALTKLPSE